MRILPTEETDTLSNEIFDLQNSIRADPTSFVSTLTSYMELFTDNYLTIDGVETLTHEGPEAV